MTKPALQRGLNTMIFADVVGYSKLREEQAPTFFVSFLGMIAELMQRERLRPLFSNTWGDGLFVVYERVEQAAEFSAALLQAMVRTDWVALGLPVQLAARVAMHTGPVFAAEDRVIGRTNFFGSHVTRAARIEPITSPGSVFLTEQAACMLVTQPGHPFRVEYVGRLSLAKAYGQEKLYRLVC